MELTMLLYVDIFGVAQGWILKPCYTSESFETLARSNVSRIFSSYLKIDKNRDLLWHIFHLIYHLHSKFYKLYRPTEMKSEIKLICRIKKKEKNITNDCQCDSRLRCDDAERLQRFNVNLLWAKCSLRKLELLLGDDLLGQEECELPLWLICLVQVD